MKVALFGQTGQVATEVRRRSPDGVNVVAIGRDRADFSSPEMVAATVSSLNADVIINAVAYTAVDKAEREPDTADLVNHLSVAALADAATMRQIPLVHISTDYVFDGSGRNAWQPGAPKAPLGVYGVTKLAGEEAIRSSGGAHVILRTSWVFSAQGANFVKTMLRLGTERDQLSVVSDQIGGPTPASAIADAVFAISRALTDGQPGGTYHFSGTPEVSWAIFAREIFQQSDLNVDVTDILTADYPTRAKRPLNSRLDCESLTHDFGIRRPDWRNELANVLKDLGAT